MMGQCSCQLSKNKSSAPGHRPALLRAVLHSAATSCVAVSERGSFSKFSPCGPHCQPVQAATAKQAQVLFCCSCGSPGRNVDLLARHARRGVICEFPSLYFFLTSFLFGCSVGRRSVRSDCQAKDLLREAACGSKQTGAADLEKCCSPGRDLPA